MKKVLSSPIFWLVLVIFTLFRELIFLGKIPLPIDNLVGSYFPWLDYKWGYAVGVPVKNPITSDAFSQFFVWKELSLDLAKQGLVPLWNKYSFSGTPLLATFHTSVFFPANLLLFWPSFNIGWGWFILGSVLAPALSMCLFLRTSVKSKTGQITGSLIYALAGPMTTWSQFGTAAWATALLPLIFFCLDRLIATRRPVFSALLSVLITFLTFAGHVQLLTYTALVATIYFLYRQKTVVGKIDLGLSLTTTLAAFIGLGLGAIQLLPTLDFYTRSIRAEENYARLFNLGLSDWTQAIRLWAADFFGHPATYNHFSPFFYHEYSSYLGVLTLPLIIGYLFSKKDQKVSRFFIWLFFISLFLAFDNPLSHLVFGLPFPLLTYSSASRLLFLTNLGAAFLAATAVENIITDKKALIKTVIVSLILSAITLVGVLFVDPLHRNVSLRNSLFYLALIFVFLLGSFFLKKKKSLLVLLIVLIFALDLGRYYLKYNPFVSQTLVFPPTPITDFLKTQPGPFRVAREDTNLLPANSWTAYGLESVEGYDPLFSLDYAHFFHRLSDNSYFNGVSRYALLDGINEPFLAAANVKYILTKNTTEPTAKHYLADQLIKSGYRSVFTDKSVTVYEDPKVMGRAYFVAKLYFVHDKSEMGKILDEPLFDPTREAVVLGEPFTVSPSPAEVISLKHGDNEVGLTVETAAENFLILADAFDPGWKVTVNGKRSPVYQVNGAFRGVRVPAGESRIIFRYQPDSFRLGLVISVFSLLLLIITLTGAHLTGRRKP